MQNVQAPIKRKRRVLDDLRWGVGWGLVMAVALVIFVALLLVIRGPQLLDQYQLTFGSVAGLYLLGGLIGGLLLGLLRPLVKWRWGAAVVGMLIAIPFGLGVRLLDAGLSPWDYKDTLVLTIFSLALGGPLGWIYWGIARDIPLKGGW